MRYDINESDIIFSAQCFVDRLSHEDFLNPDTRLREATHLIHTLGGEGLAQQWGREFDVALKTRGVNE
jgi:hypothetical protein